MWRSVPFEYRRNKRIQFAFHLSTRQSGFYRFSVPFQDYLYSYTITRSVFDEALSIGGARRGATQ